MTLASFLNLSIKLSTLSILIPALRAGGSSTLSITFLGVKSIPKSEAEIVSKGFCLDC